MSERTQDPNVIKETVRQHYATRIQSGSCCSSPASSCCMDTRPNEIALYGTEAIESLPEGVVTTSFGCGNPIALASLQRGEVVVDLGSGGGLDVLLAAERVGPEGFVYGVDMTEEMLSVARSNALKVGATNVAFLKGDIEAIPLPDNTASVVISNCVINLSPEKSRVLSEAFRVLKPGGRLAVSDIVIDGDLSGLPVSEEQIRSALSWSGCIAGALTRQQYQQYLTDAGLTEIALDVQYRYTRDDLLDDAPANIASLPPEIIKELTNRFTSCSICARKPEA